jgi:RNA polymerase sigma factor (sigma-70 family)
MQELGDVELLKEYARSGSEEAFSTLVSRHINLVFGAAMRQTGDPHRSEEISQVVFIILAKKAGSLSDATILPGWLFQTTRLTAANLRRTEFRRAQREREAIAQSPETGSKEEDTWERIAPMLDLALAGLKEKDRNAILIRFMEGNNFQEVGEAIGTTAAAAQKRVNRAVEKLRAFFAKRGVVLTGAALGGVLATKSAPAAPLGVVSGIKAAAVSKGVSAGPSTAALMKGTLKTMGWSYPKQMGAVLLAALLLTGAGLGSLSARREIPDGLTPGDIYRRTRQRYDSLTSYRANGEESMGYGGQRKTFAFYTHLGRPDYYRVEWAMPIFTEGNIETVPDLGALWSAGKGPFIMTGSLPAPGSGRTPSPLQTFLCCKMDDDQRAIISVLGLADGAMSVPVIFLKPGFDRLNEIAEGPDVQRLKDETVDGFRCFVLARTFGHKFAKSGTPPRMEKFWIGKNDFLIHQIENDTVGINPFQPKQTASSTVTLIKFRNIKVDEPVSARDFDYPMPRYFEMQTNFP